MSEHAKRNQILITDKALTNETLTFKFTNLEFTSVAYQTWDLMEIGRVVSYQIECIIYISHSLNNKRFDLS